MIPFSTHKCPSCGGELLQKQELNNKHYYCDNKFIFVNEDNQLDECNCFYMEINKFNKNKIIIFRYLPIDGKIYHFQNNRESNKVNLFQNHKFLSSKFNPEWLLLPQDDLIKKIKYWLLLK